MAAAGRKNGELLIGKRAGGGESIFWNYSTKFALLYNVQGLKYTIGKRFECRKCQGEFLFCEGGGVAESSHCEITCGDEGQFWVNDLQGLTGKGTFINGERIESRVELKFGDFLSLGGPGPAKRQVTADEGVYFEYELSAENNARDMCTVFRFQAVKEIVDTATEIESHSQVQSSDTNANLFRDCPLRNSLVLSNIFNYLPLSVVKTCRFVCSDWNKEATKVLKSNAVAVFSYPKGYSSELGSTTTNRSRLFSFVHEMGNFFPQGRFCITLPANPLPVYLCPSHEAEEDNSGTRDVKENPDNKMLSDLKWFFNMNQGFPHPVTKLSLTGTIRLKSGHDLFLAVLQGSPYLEDLELEMNLDLHVIYSMNVPQPFRITFPSLKKLSVKINSYIVTCNVFGCSDNDEYEFESLDKMKKWMSSMITGAPILQHLKLAADDDFNEVRDEFAELFLHKIIAEKGFQNLNSLNVDMYNYCTLESIMKLPDLTSLTLGMSPLEFEYDRGLDGGKDADGKDKPQWTALMRNLLQKSAKTLKHLDFTMPSFNYATDAIHVPVLPNLKVLKLKELYPDWIVLPEVEIGFSFKDHFPVLEIFCVSLSDMWLENCTFLQEKKYFFDTFFPRLAIDHDDTDDEEDCQDDSSTDDEDGEPKEVRKRFCGRLKLKDKRHIVKSVRWLEIQHLQGCSPTSINRIDKLFPNAFNEHLEAARAKYLARTKWDWSKWCYIQGSGQEPVNPKAVRAKIQKKVLARSKWSWPNWRYVKELAPVIPKNKKTD